MKNLFDKKIPTVNLGTPVAMGKGAVNMPKAPAEAKIKMPSPSGCKTCPGSMRGK
jgi:hypothetical protein